MKRLLSPKLILLFVFAVGAFGTVFSQDVPPPDTGKAPVDRLPGRPAKRPNLVQLLGLSPEQARQVRQMNQARKPLMEAAMQRLRTANRALDDAIYADNVDDVSFQTCLKEVQLAQAEVAKLRFMSELEVRKILTPDQLARFRDMRKRFQDKVNPDGPPPGDKGQPFQPQRRGPGRIPSN